MRSLSAIIGIAALAFAVPAAAQYPYFIQYALTLDSAPTCTSTVVQVTATGTFSANLATTANNAVIYYVVNGHATTQTETVPGTFPISVTLTANTIQVTMPTPTTPPYTYSAAIFPLVNGVPTGLGSVISGVCNADLTATLNIVNNVPAPVSSVAVPALRDSMLTLLGVLLALAAVRRLRRRTVLRA